jgi:hypothetical protein
LPELEIPFRKMTVPAAIGRPSPDLVEEEASRCTSLGTVGIVALGARAVATAAAHSALVRP